MMLEMTRTGCGWLQIRAARDNRAPLLMRIGCRARDRRSVWCDQSRRCSSAARPCARRVAGAADGRDGGDSRRRGRSISPSAPATSTTGAFRPSRRPGFIHWQDLTTRCPSSACAAAVGSMVEIQASYEFIDNDESTQRTVTSHTYGGGDARLFTKIYARARAHVDSRPWACVSAPSCPNANSRGPPRHRRDRLLHPVARLEATSATAPRTSTSASRCSAIPARRRRLARTTSSRALSVWSRPRSAPMTADRWGIARSAEVAGARPARASNNDGDAMRAGAAGRCTAA